MTLTTLNHSNILTCLNMNLANAKSEPMREHVRQQIADFEKHLQPKPKTTPKPRPSWDRIIPNERHP